MIRSSFTVTVLLLFVLGVASVVAAQTVFESSDGESSLVLRDGGLIHVNFADANVSFGLTRQVSTDRWRVGIDGKLKAKDSFVSLADKGFTLQSGTISGFTGYEMLPADSLFQYHFVGGRLQYTRASLDIISTESTTLEAVSTKFNGVTAGVFYNGFIDTARGSGGGQELLLGVGVDYGGRHNADSLDDVQVCDVSHSVTTTEATRTVSKCDSASFGAYETSNRLTASLNLLWYQSWSSNRVALAFLGTYDELKHKRPFVPGFGVFVTESGAPLKMQGGITLEAIDGKPKVGLQVGFPF